MNVYEILKKLNIIYSEVEHEAVYTVEEAKKIKNMIEGVGCKNLFLKDKENFYIYILKDDKRADLKLLKELINTSKLHFASEEELNNLLGLIKGSVTPFGIINDKEHKVIILIDEDLENSKLLFHPNINTKTISIEYNDLIEFIKYQTNKYLIIKQKN